MELAEAYEHMHNIMGLRVEELPDLEPPVIYLRRQRLALISSSLPEECRHQILERLFLAECGAPLHAT